MEHYICKGTCHGVSTEEGICTGEGCDQQYELLESCSCEDGKHGASEKAETEVITRDSNGTVLKDGDDVHLIKDLPIKGSSQVYKRGTLAKNIRLTQNPHQVEWGSGKSTIVLKTEFLKKV
jgi:protein PhnA